MCTIGCYCHRPRNKRCTLLKILWLDSERFIALHIIPQLFTKIHEEFYCVIADQLVGKGCLSNADAAAAATTYQEAIAGHPLFVAQRLVVIIRGSHEISLEIFTRLKMTTRRRRFWSVPLSSIYSSIYNDGPDSKLVKKGLKCGQKWGRFYCHCLHHCHGRQLSMDGAMMDARTLFLLRWWNFLRSTTQCLCHFANSGLILEI